MPVTSSARRSFVPLAGRLGALLFALFLLLPLSALAQPADPGAARARVDSIRGELTQIETVLTNPAASDAELARQ
ncbi:hypothetical protein, partial [Bosea sp. (in: a-proteobacteria)]|uniref:hypothetical protein n=1 Tax=Bosea sp. (in: a-proteobacteria) TaxID=1871050 RepID=UPI002FC8C960